MKVSVIIPCYNGANYLTECLTSVSQQNYEYIETIVVNDGSDDESQLILENWNKTEPMKVKLVQTGKKGAGYARNAGLQLSTGDFIQFLDVDDLLLDNKISHQIDLARNPENLPDIIAGSYRLDSEIGSGRIIKPYSNDAWTALITSRLGITSSNLFKKKSLNEIGGFNTTQKSSQEYEMMFRLMQKKICTVLFDNEINTIKRVINPYSISSSNKTQNLERYIQLRHDIKTFLQNSNSEKKHIYECDNEIFRVIHKLYQYNRELGIKLHKKYIPSGFTPISSFNTSRVNLPRYYKFVYKIFGFRISEKIYRLASRFKNK